MLHKSFDKSITALKSYLPPPPGLLRALQNVFYCVICNRAVRYPATQCVQCARFFCEDCIDRTRRARESYANSGPPPCPRCRASNKWRPIEWEDFDTLLMELQNMEEEDYE